MCIIVFVFSHIIFILAECARSNLSLVDKHTLPLREGEIFIYLCTRASLLSLSHAQKKKAGACAPRNVHASRQPERDLISSAAGDTRRAQKHTQAHRICLRLNRFFSFSWESSCFWENTRSARVSRMKANVICNVRPRCGSCIYLEIFMICGYPRRDTSCQIAAPLI